MSRTIPQLLKLKSSYDMTPDERYNFLEWLDKEARYTIGGYDYCELLGWYLLDERIPISPKEAGLD